MTGEVAAARVGMGNGKLRDAGACCWVWAWRMAGDGCVDVAGVEGAGEADGWAEFWGTVCNGGAGGCVFCCTGVADCGGGAEVSVGVGAGFSVLGVGALAGGRSEGA